MLGLVELDEADEESARMGGIRLNKLCFTREGVR
jgi:hypothetical protein